MPVLPEKFIARMKQRLPADEWEAFLAVYEQKAVKGVRVNTLKLSPEQFEKIAPFALEKVPYSENAYFVEEEKVGGYAAHFAGLFYSQEPSATAAAPALEISAGERVLDLCSAPGGKGTQAAAYLKGEGLIVLNEPIFSRAQILSSNVERMGVENALVTCEYPEKLAKRFPAYFDKILVDAPCSGEGMFRKNEKEALGEWSEQNVALCAARQKEILGFAYSMLKAGGKMVYSTCTFSEEEDEWQVQDFLSTHPNMRLLKQTKLLPHRQKGEGHFRVLETEAAASLAEKGGDLVVSVGGGMVLNGENVRLLKQGGRIVYLQASKETLLGRLLGDTSRPLLAGQDLSVRLDELLAARSSVYEKASDCAVCVDEKTPARIADEIIEKLGL
jgi:16S rRNA C967 or C1407 C5-methylase (RsmB/RsmF family)